MVAGTRVYIRAECPKCYRKRTFATVQAANEWAREHDKQHE